MQPTIETVEKLLRGLIDEIDQLAGAPPTPDTCARLRRISTNLCLVLNAMWWEQAVEDNEEARKHREETVRVDVP